NVKDYRGALNYLAQLEKLEKGLILGIALDKMAWAHYFLDDIPLAFQALGREVAELDPGNASDSQVLARTVQPASLFFMRGFEKSLAQYRPEQALATFQELFTKEPKLAEQALIQLAFHLRSKDKDTELSQLLAANKKMKSLTLDLAAVIGGHQLNQRKYEQMRETALSASKTLTELSADEKQDYQTNGGRLIKELANWMRELQARYGKNKDNSDAKRISLVLVPLYETHLKFPGKEKDAPIRFNLAEIQFGQGNFGPATLNYRWIHRNQKKTMPAAELRSIESRFKELEIKNLTARNLAARALPESTDSPDRPKELTEWIDWVDAFAADHRFAPPGDAFYFEANRALYKTGDLHGALDRMVAFAQKHPSSAHAKGSASLALDTWIASSKWDRAQKFAETLMKDPVWRKNAMFADLHRIAGDARIRLLEEAASRDTLEESDAKEILAMIQEFQTQYPTHARLPRALEVGATVSVKRGEKVAARGFFQALQASGK
ncbi:MAG: hypothetical protein AAB425_04455, partial [Bdellovibrionota bacterium]